MMTHHIDLTFCICYIYLQHISEIVKFASSVYHVNFQLFDKVDVIGDRASPLWTFLKGICLHCVMRPLYTTLHR